MPLPKTGKQPLSFAPRYWEDCPFWLPMNGTPQPHPTSQHFCSYTSYVGQHVQNQKALPPNSTQHRFSAKVFLLLLKTIPNCWQLLKYVSYGTVSK